MSYGSARSYGIPMSMSSSSSSRSPATLKNLNTEKKALDIPNANYLCNQTAVITPLNLIRVGSTFCNRIGRKVEMKSIQLDGFFQVIRTLAAGDYLRVLIIYDRQTNGALPAIADILQDTDQATANTTNNLSHANVNNVDRFIILRDHRHVVPALTSTAGVITNPGFMDPVSPTLRISDYVKLKGLITQYKADSSPAVIGDIASGGLYMVTFGGNVAGAEAWQFTGTLRLRYVDL